MIGKQIIAVVNFPPKQIANFLSECLVLGVYNQQNEVVLLQPAQPALSGGRLAVDARGVVTVAGDQLGGDVEAADVTDESTVPRPLASGPMLRARKASTCSYIARRRA